MERVRIGGVDISRFLLGSNPISGFSHQSKEMDAVMKGWFTSERVMQLLREAESLGISTFLARTDANILSIVREYREGGGRVQWFAQTCPGEAPTDECIDRAAAGGAKACHIHGGVMDNLLANDNLGEVPGWVAKIRSAGMQAGIGGHDPAVFEWAEKNLDADYYMCSYYNSMRRDQNPAHVHGAKEWFWPEDREIMTAVIQRLSRPVIHYKILAAGRNDPAEAFAFVVKSMRASDMVCVGVYNEGKPNMLREDVELFEKAWDLKPQATN